MCSSKWGIAPVDHHHPILRLADANSGLSVFIKLELVSYICPLCVWAQS